MNATGVRERPAAGPSFTGMVVFLASEAFLFGSLFFSYFYFKINSTAWPPAGVRLDSGLAAVNTAILLSSSVVVWAAARFIRKGRTKALAAGLLGAALLGAAFLGVTVWEWTHESFLPWKSAYGAIFYTRTGFHALHVVGGVLLLVALSLRARRGLYSAEKHLGVEVGSLYWHYVDFIWLLVFATLFLIR